MLVRGVIDGQVIEFQSNLNCEHTSLYIASEFRSDQSKFVEKMFFMIKAFIINVI